MCDLINSDHHFNPILLIRFHVSLFFCYDPFTNNMYIWIFRSLYSSFIYLSVRYFFHLFSSIVNAHRKKSTYAVFFLFYRLVQGALNFNNIDFKSWDCSLNTSQVLFSHTALNKYTNSFGCVNGLIRKLIVKSTVQIYGHLVVWPFQKFSWIKSIKVLSIISPDFTTTMHNVDFIIMEKQIFGDEKSS